MPFRLSPTTTKIQFTTAAWMPHTVYRACQATGVVSGTVYYQRAVCEALARDLGLDLDDLLATLPPPRGGSLRQIASHTVHIGPANTVEEVE